MEGEKYVGMMEGWVSGIELKLLLIDEKMCKMG